MTPMPTGTPWRKRLLRAGGLLMGATVIGQACAFGKELLTAHYFGTTPGLSAYFAAWLIPEIISLIIAGGLGATLISLASELTDENRDQITMALLGLVLIGLLVLALGLALAAPVLVRLLYAPFTADLSRLCLVLFELLLPVMLISIIDALLGSLLQARRQFQPVAVSQAAAAIIGLAVLWLTVSRAGLYALVLGLGSGLLVGVLVKLQTLARGCSGMKLSLRPALPYLRRWLALSLPLLLGTAIVRLNPLVDNVMGLALGPRSIAVLHYAYNLFFLPYLLISASLGTALYPELTAAFSGREYARIRERLGWGIELSVHLMLPVLALFMVLALPLVAVLFQHGEFTRADATLTAWVLRAYALGLVVTAVNGLFSRALVAIQDRRGVIFFTIFAFVANILGNGAAILLLGGGYRSLVGIALATTVVAVLLCLLAKWRLERLLTCRLLADWKRSAVRPAVATLGSILIASVCWSCWQQGGYAGAGRPALLLGMTLASAGGLLAYGWVTRNELRRIMADRPGLAPAGEGEENQ